MNLEVNEYCPCCGYNTLDKNNRFQYHICDICFWEDEPIGDGANKVSLTQARKNFEEFGACEEDMKRHVRKPNKNDRRNPDFVI